MNKPIFIDYYEVLEVSPNADAGAIGRMFRYLAQRYHPDNHETGDPVRFDQVVQAHKTLKDKSRRAKYDARYREQIKGSPDSIEETANGKIVEKDVDIQDRLLTTFYLKRRQSVRDPGIPEFELEHMFGCPIDEIEFHLWYMKAKGWITRLENGMYAITVEGIDHINSEHHRKATTKLLLDRSHDK
jgi:curved DNA-binding protein CbpA